MRDAFLGNLAADGIVFQPLATNGLDVWKNRKAVPVLLTWEPETADISSGGDFGFTTGPWEARDYSGRRSPPLFGYYMSVWKKQDDGSWKVLLDLGTRLERADTAVVVFRAMPSFGEKQAPSRHDEESRLKITEDEVMKRVQQDGFFSAKSFFHDGIRIHRDDMFPLRSLDALLRTPSLDVRAEYSQPVILMAPQEDLACVYGRWSEGRTEGNYVRIWKRSGKTWKIILDLMRPDSGK